jgi:alpha-L-rhamnosidase
MRRTVPLAYAAVCSFVIASVLPAQRVEKTYRPNPLDLTARISSPRLESRLHQPLPEQYIWAMMPRNAGMGFSLPRGAYAPRWTYFRRTFDLSSIPKAATLYVTGPARLRVFLNGRRVADAQRDATSKIDPFLLIVNAGPWLRPGQNALAIAAAGARQSGFSFGSSSRLAVKLVPQPLEVNAPALVMSGPGWKYSTQEQSGWQQPGFSDSGWRPVAVLGGIESNIDFFQANQDADMYRWPGYDGISPFLARMPVRAASVLDAFDGLGGLHNTGVLAAGRDQLAKGFALDIPRRGTGVQPVEATAKMAMPQQEQNSRYPAHNGLSAATGGDFTVDLPGIKVPASEYPSMVLDFGRESTGRIKVVSDSDEPMRLTVQYGESLGEALEEPYLGVDEIDVPPHSTVYGPKSAFRYAKLRFLAGSSPLRFKTIELDDIYYPVHYRGEFESSDPLLDRIWQVGAYTSHLCMQDDIWDAPKRDRARWMGDLDVSGHVIDAVFADRFLMQETLDYLIRDAGRPVSRDVNGIPGYSAFWVMGEADYYRHTGDLNYLRSVHEPLVQLLDYMASETDARSVFTNPRHAWPFVDWSPGMAPSFGLETRPISETAPNAQRATQFEFYAAFKEGAWLLRQIGDSAHAESFAAKAEAIRNAALQTMLDGRTGTFGDRWQPNAMAIYSGLADAAETQTIWQKVLSHPDKYRITPYYNFYVISAMAEAGQYEAALDWIRKYWGGMIRRGATSFWEAYNLGLPKHGWHRMLRADFGQGYFVSLAHGWSSGPTVWLTEEILGIKPTVPGFKQVSIRPELADLKWAGGAEPTPRGLIKVNYHSAPDAHFTASIDLPPETRAAVSLPVTKGSTTIHVNGQIESGTSAEGGRRAIIHLDRPGHYTLTSQ